VLLASPAEAVLKDALPDAEIDWLVGPWSAEMARRAGASGKVLTVDFPGFTRRSKRNVVEPYMLLYDEPARLRAEQYDAALILRPDHWWGAMLTSLAGIPRRFGYSVAECTPFLTDSLPAPTGHAALANLFLARLAALRLGGQPIPNGTIVPPRFTLTEGERIWARGAVGRRGASVRGRRPLIAIHPGAGAALKSWPAERWAEVADALHQQANAEVVLTGGPGERALTDQIAGRLTPRPASFAGETTLGQLAALFTRCDLVIGGDSGPLHLAATVGAATVRLYGPTDIQEFGPWPPTDHHVALAAELPCQPCRTLVDPPCGATELPPCLQALDVRLVSSIALQILDRRRAERSTDEAAGPAPVGDSC
jgi:lipopolysaccharide heptosyltransferase II